MTIDIFPVKTYIRNNINKIIKKVFLIINFQKQHRCDYLFVAAGKIAAKLLNNIFETQKNNPLIIGKNNCCQ